MLLSKIVVEYLHPFFPGCSQIIQTNCLRFCSNLTWPKCLDYKAIKVKLEIQFLATSTQFYILRVQECFVRKKTRDQEKCTHLVVNAPDGSKYNAALKWGIPAVTK